MTKRLTFIDDVNESHEPDDFSIVDTNFKSNFRDAMRVKVADDDIPASLSNSGAATMLDWEVVVTFEGDTYTGRVVDGERQHRKTYLTLMVDT